MIRSISYSRYLRTAVAMAVHRHKNATLCSTFTTAEFSQIDAINTTASTSAAAAHHFSCNRSSPDDLANLMTTATTLTSSPALIRKPAITSSSGVRPFRLPGLEVNGCAHNRVAVISVDTVAMANAPPANHAAGRHRRERSCPVGKSKNKKASAATAIIQIQLDSQANTGPAGRETRSATSACSAYGVEKAIQAQPQPRHQEQPANPVFRPPGRKDKARHRDGHVHHLPGDVGDGPVSQAGRHQMPVHVGQRQPAADQRH